MDDSVGFAVVHKLNSVFLIPLLGMEVQFGVYLFADQFLYLLVNVVRQLLVLVLETQVYDRFVQQVLTVGEILVL